MAKAPVKKTSPSSKVKISPARKTITVTQFKRIQTAEGWKKMQKAKGK